MQQIINQATKHLCNCTDRIVEARTAMHEAEDSPHFTGNLVDLRDRIEELDAILDDLNEVQAYLENIDLDF